MKEYKFEEEMCVALAFTLAVGNKVPNDFKKSIIPVISFFFLGAGKEPLAQLENFTFSKYINVINSPYEGLIVEMTFRHSVFMITEKQPL